MNSESTITSQALRNSRAESVGDDSATRPVAKNSQLPDSHLGDVQALRMLVQSLATPSVGEWEFPQSDTAWVVWTQLVLRENLAGIVLDRAGDHSKSWPTFVVKTLRNQSDVIVATNIHLEHRLEHLLTAFNRARVPVMLLKGAALNRLLYDHPQLRFMTDIDLMVRPQHVKQAGELLEWSGFRPGASLIRADFFPRFHYETEWLADGPQPVKIDLHARPFRPLRYSRVMPDDALWTDAPAVRVGDATAAVPCAENMLIHLCAHAAFHGCDRLVWLYDIHRLAMHRSADLDWPLITQNVREWRLSAAVERATWLTERMFGALIPNEARRELSRHRSNWRDRLVLAQSPRDAGRPLRHVLVNVLTTPGVAFRCKYLTALALPSREHLASLYPFRHHGWKLAASVWRPLRALFRVMSIPFRNWATHT